MSLRKLRTLKRKATKELVEFYRRLCRSFKKRKREAKPVIDAAFDEITQRAIALLKDRAFKLLAKLAKEIQKPRLRTRPFRKWIVATIKKDAKAAGEEGFEFAKKVLRETAIDLILKTFVNAKKNLEG